MEGMDVRAKHLEARYGQLWTLLRGYCNRPIDIATVSLILFILSLH